MKLTSQQRLLLHSAKSWARDIAVFVDDALEDGSTENAKNGMSEAIKSGRVSVKRLTQVQEKF